MLALEHKKKTFIDTFLFFAVFGHTRMHEIRDGILENTNKRDLLSECINQYSKKTAKSNQIEFLDLMCNLLTK